MAYGQKASAFEPLSVKNIRVRLMHPYDFYHVYRLATFASKYLGKKNKTVYSKCFLFGTSSDVNF